MPLLNRITQQPSGVMVAVCSASHACDYAQAHGRAKVVLEEVGGPMGKREDSTSRTQWDHCNPAYPLISFSFLLHTGVRLCDRHVWLGASALMSSSTA